MQGGAVRRRNRQNASNTPGLQSSSSNSCGDLGARNDDERRISLGGGNYYVALGGYISGDRAGRGALWFYRDCLGGSGNCEASVFPVPGCVSDPVYRR